jgi:cell division control protein 6
MAISNVFDAFQRSHPLITNPTALSLDHIPQKIVHRDQQIKALANMLAPILSGYPPFNIIVSGQPGTGKSVTVDYVLNLLEEKAKEKNIDLTVVRCNCRLKPTLYATLSEIAKTMDIDPKSRHQSSNIISAITDRLKGTKGLLVVSLDEVDRSQELGDIMAVLIRLNEMMRETKVSFIAISNKVALKSFFTSIPGSQKNKGFVVDEGSISRIKTTTMEVMFPRYSADELKDILKNRIGEAFYSREAVADGAVSLIAAYASQANGHARYAINLLAAAAKLAQAAGSNVVKEEHVEKACSEVELGLVAEHIDALAPRQYATLLSVYIARKGSTGPVNSGVVYQTFLSIAKLRNWTWGITDRSFETRLSELHAYGLIECNVETGRLPDGRRGRTTLISMPAHVCNYLKQKEERLAAEEKKLVEEF